MHRCQQPVEHGSGLFNKVAELFKKTVPAHHFISRWRSADPAQFVKVVHLANDATRFTSSRLRRITDSIGGM